MLKGIASELGYSLHIWSITNGRVDLSQEKPVSQDENELQILQAVVGMEEKSILILRDYHMILKDPNPVIYRTLKDVLLHAKTANKVIVILSPALDLPAELSKLFVVEEFKLPTRDDLLVVVTNICENNGKEIPNQADLDGILDAAMGLTTNEAEDAFALSIIETGGLSPAVISREKASAVKKNGLLEIIEPKVKPEDIGGLEVLKEDLLSKRMNFTRAARDYGLTSPRGILVVGQAGTGKSLTSQACGSIFGIPTLKLEAGSLFGGLVGQSEQNWRTAFSTAKAVAPCVFWIDEAEGLFCGAKSSGTTDGGTTNRVVKSVLQSMQFDSEGIFWVFTANDIDGFPDALIDRLDVWSVDLPTKDEREAIWKIHIAKRKRNAASFKIVELAKATEGFSGRQIEQVWLKAMTIAFSDGGREPTTQDALFAASQFTPTSKTMEASIQARRERLSGKATPASKQENKTITMSTNRKLAA